MKKQKLTLIAAVAKNNHIGINNLMPWHIPADFKFFKEYTWEKPVIMGRKTWDSLQRKPLPGRRNIVITRQTNLQKNGAEFVGSLKEALDLLSSGNYEEIIIMGGGQVYADAMPLATDLQITHVDLDVPSDTQFPEIKRDEWQEIEAETKSVHADTTINGKKRSVEIRFTHYKRRID
ncbi:dihydrofolate reductase [Stenoxybacter acetivorans]|uniref:dihydrofolate reductase n=1 Tax=Stenoxybacter acetivorans TaxID=422441 RepID=UPI000A034D1A|nr:dihydrofolate reductase [Stenoxybacter acetivorans]